MRTLLRPTGFVDSPFGHDGKVARLAGGLNWFASVELIGVDGNARISAELVPVEGVESRFDDEMRARTNEKRSMRWRLKSGCSPRSSVSTVAACTSCARC